MKGLTKRQSEMLRFIQEFIAENNYSPSFREIQTHFGFSSLGTVYNHLRILKRKGLVTAEKQGRRSITPAIEPHAHTIGIFSLPLAGQVCGGHAIELYTDTRDVDVPEAFAPYPDSTYVLEVKGDGFNEELIAQSDLLVLEVSQKVHHGQVMLLEINRNETLIKKIYDEGNFVRLEGVTVQRQSMILRKEDVYIHGLVRAIIRAL